jgi:hypothetical protein
MKVGVLTLLVVGLAAAVAIGEPAGPGEPRALAGPGGSIVASIDGGDRWQLVHVCPPAPGRPLPVGDRELLAADESVPGAGPCPAATVVSFSGQVLRITCDGGELFEWSAGLGRAIPIGEAACIERPSAIGAGPALAADRPIRVSRRSLRRRLVPRLAMGLERRTRHDVSAGHLTGVDRRTEIIFWIRLTWRLDELAAP